MQQTPISELSKRVGNEARIDAWVQTIRHQGSIVFLILRDITGTVQAVIGSDKPSLIKAANDLTPESVVQVKGLLKEEQQAPGGFEIAVNEFVVLSLAASPLPIPIGERAENEAAQEKRLDWRWLDLRKPERALVFKIWTVMEQAFRQYCVENGYTQIHSPKTVVTSTESGSELFEIKYFGQKAYLAQSPQLYKQMAMAAGLEKVFEVGPVFRANPSFTSRHDTEFTMYDVELSFIDSHHELMAEEERMMMAMFTAIRESYAAQIQETFGQELEVPQAPFPKLTLKEVKKILAELGVPNERGEDLSPEEERVISKYIKEKEGSDFLFIHEWPAKVRAFYSMRDEKDPAVTKSFDLLYRGLEVTSGAQREHRVEQLQRQIQEQGLALEPFESYLDFFRYGCPPHGGFAPGPSRLLMQVLGLSNVREVTFLYRGVKRITP